MIHTEPRTNRKRQFERQTTKPTPLSMMPDGIPTSMKARPQWVVWRLVRKVKDGIGKWTKPPFQAKRPEIGASSTDPATWATFAEAMATYQRAGFDGIGYVFGGDEVGIDLDDVRDPVTGVIEPWAIEIVNTTDSHAEISPSATGIKIIAKGSIAKGRKFTEIGAEMYCKGRYFTVTGHVISERSIVEGRQAEIDAVYKTLDDRNEAAKKAKAEAKAKSKSSGTFKPPPPRSVILTDDEIIAKASAATGDAGKKFRDFMQGGINGYPSQSEADLAFCNLIVFWTDDPDQVRRIVQRSGLNRDKWERDDYAERTIKLAFDGRTNRYDPNYRSNGQAHHEGNGPADAGSGDGGDGGDDDYETDKSETQAGQSPIHHGGFTNFYEIDVGEKKPIKFGFPIRNLHEACQQLTGGWPKAANGLLFAERNHEPLWMKSPAELFAWIGGQVKNGASQNPLRWTQGDDKVPPQQFHAYTLQNAEQFDAVEPYPHFPPLAKHYYMHPRLSGTDSGAFHELLRRFQPSTLVDHDLFAAAWMTPFAGIEPGQRPAFLIQAEDDDKHGGRGAGKTTLVEMIGRLCGGHVEMSAADDWERLKTRLLSPAALTKRIALLDNVKTLRFSWADLEAGITAAVISGRQLYVGEGRRPNDLTYFITLNGANLSKDMAQRSVPIMLKRPEYDATWEEQVIPDNAPPIDKRAFGCRQVAAEQELTTTKGLKIMMTGCLQQLTLWELGPQQVTVTFQGGRIVSDAGLLGMRKLDKELGVLSVLAERLPDPRTPNFIVHTREALLTQQVYQILAGYPDCNDAQTLRNDPLFHTLLDQSAEEDAKPLASGSTLARFAQAFTRREAELPLEERPVLLEVAAAQNQRLKILNDYLPELFIRTRRTRPAFIILDIDASDDPTHGQQVLSFYHGHYEQHQYFPLYVFDGTTGFPLAAWLRPGTVHASCGALDTLKIIIDHLRRVWPGITILVRGDGGFAVPAMYEFCETEGLLYAFGYSTNSVLLERTDTMAADLETYYRCYGERDPHVQRFDVFEDYQAKDWTRPRRIVAKVEINRQGVNRRFVVTNMSGHPQGLYQGFYVQRGAVPEQPIGELKNGLLADRLSFHHFRANSWKLLEHVTAYALVILHREATAAIPEVAKAQVSTLRSTLWKVGAIVQTSVRRIWFHFSETWPHQNLWQRVYAAIVEFVAQVQHGNLTTPGTPAALLM